MLYMPHNTSLQKLQTLLGMINTLLPKQTEEKSDPNNPDAAIANKKVNIIGLLT